MKDPIKDLKTELVNRWEVRPSRYSTPSVFDDLNYSPEVEPNHVWFRINIPDYSKMWRENRWHWWQFWRKKHVIIVRHRCRKLWYQLWRPRCRCVY